MRCARASGDAIEVEVSMETAPSVLWDAVVLADGEGAAESLARIGQAIEFVKDQYRHCKTILALRAGAALLDRAGIPRALPSGKPDPGVLQARLRRCQRSAGAIRESGSEASALRAGNRSTSCLILEEPIMAVSHQLKELLLQSLEHERGGALIYQTALECVLNDDLREEWEKYLNQTLDHVDALSAACAALGLDPDEVTPGRKIVQHNGKSLVVAMKMALAASDPPAAQLVACECVVLAETKDHFDWELIGECAKTLTGNEQAALAQAYEQVEDQEDEHLYHTKGWCRELWLQALGMEAVLPPPEEKKDVKTAIDAAKTAQQRKH